ncbi:MAG: ribonuclease HII [Candidatus Bipolaricaulota bacterium]|nr:ribonuclease HII [Candidatus Bipolaricaulota bacterium]MCS7274994.1 ribonuclease HII [Candidatus Bipolaricaulota bacterium]MDW8110541.1 ribonuclease HII [Candidatus Bipolaricaulota bacterium]MDW8329308.1 ribonuclease HII [Candidatus Bipolaricaulota bacterium]
MRILGIDEAGRGCVIGPLVVAGVWIERDRLQALETLGVRDSKQLTRARRTEIAEAIQKIANVVVLEIPVAQLQENLTRVELHAIAEIIQNSNAHRVYLDLPVGPRAQERFVQRLRPAVQSAFELIAENRADARYPIVSAASIVAKVRRDSAIERLHQEYGDFGWGYPSEPKTRAFLKEFYARHGRFPECARLKWQTLQRLLKPTSTEISLFGQKRP